MSFTKLFACSALALSALGLTNCATSNNPQVVKGNFVQIYSKPVEMRQWRHPAELFNSPSSYAARRISPHRFRKTLPDRPRSTHHLYDWESGHTLNLSDPLDPWGYGAEGRAYHEYLKLRKLESNPNHPKTED